MWKWKSCHGHTSATWLTLPATKHPLLSLYLQCFELLNTLGAVNHSLVQSAGLGSHNIESESRATHSLLIGGHWLEPRAFNLREN
jgi:hypothetical protein